MAELLREHRYRPMGVCVGAAGCGGGHECARGVRGGFSWPKYPETGPPPHWGDEDNEVAWLGRRVMGWQLP